MLELTFNFRSGIFNPSFSQNEFILFTKKKKKKKKEKRSLCLCPSKRKKKQKEERKNSQSCVIF